jgi:hypothetical protein
MTITNHQRRATATATALRQQVTSGFRVDSESQRYTVLSSAYHSSALCNVGRSSCRAGVSGLSVVSCCCQHVSSSSGRNLVGTLASNRNGVSHSEWSSSSTDNDRDRDREYSPTSTRLRTIWDPKIQDWVEHVGWVWIPSSYIASCTASSYDSLREPTTQCFRS